MERLGKKPGLRQKLLLAFLLLVIMCFLAVLQAVGRMEEPGETVFTAFEKANFAELSCYIHREGYLDDAFYLQEEKDAFIENAYRSWEDGGLTLSFLTKEEPAGECEVRQKNYIRAELQIGYLTGQSGAERALEERQRLLAFTDRLGIGGTVYLELTGSFAGQLSGEEKHIAAESLLESMGAEQIASVDEEDLYTVYAYAGGAGETRELPEGAVNLNLAVSYDEVLDRTVFHLGCPMIAVDY